MDATWLTESPWPLLLLVFAAVGALFLLAWLLERAGQSRYARLLVEGEQAEATVLSARDTGWRTMGRVHIGYELEVRRRGHPPYQARTQLMIHRPWSAIPYPPGSIVAVRVDPARPQRVVIAAAEPVLGGAVAAASAPTVTATSQVFVVDGRTYPSLDALPPEARTAYAEAMRAFADADGNGMPDIFEAGGAASSPDAAALDRLRQLAAMRKEGLISDAEYEAKKAEILERL